MKKKGYDQYGHEATVAMINRCFRRQTPEAFGDDPVPQAEVPADLSYGRDGLVIIEQQPPLSEEVMGNPACDRDPSHQTNYGSGSGG